VPISGGVAERYPGGVNAIRGFAPTSGSVFRANVLVKYRSPYTPEDPFTIHKTLPVHNHSFSPIVPYYIILCKSDIITSLYYNSFLNNHAYGNIRSSMCLFGMNKIAQELISKKFKFQKIRCLFENTHSAQENHRCN